MITSLFGSGSSIHRVQRSLWLHVLGSCLVAALALLGGCSSAPVASVAIPQAHAPRAQPVVVAAHPLAVEAGTAVLRRGGSAMDAAVAVQLMLGLVEPQSSGLGGGAIIMAYDAKTRAIATYIGREAAPRSATPSMLQDPSGKPLTRAEAMLSGRASGVPATVAVFAEAQRAHGTLPWAQLFAETIDVAETGFTITPRLARHIDGRFAQASAKDVIDFFANPQGRPLQSGEWLRNPAYAQTLRQLARDSGESFYRGELARAIVQRVRQPPLPSGMNASDMQDYRAEHVAPLCRPLRQYTLCVPPPPASGVGLLQLMALLDETDIDQRGPQDPQAWFLFAEASRLMYADRDQYVGDPHFTQVPVDGLLDPTYLQTRRQLIGPRAGPAPAHGVPPGAPGNDSDHTNEPGGTSHFVIVDAAGNAVSVTTTIESFFGSGRMVGGFFLNNQLTDFSWTDANNPTDAANAIAPGKRPRSSMSPAILLDAQGNFVGAIGSPGGSSIPAYIGKTLVGLLYWKLPLQQAIALPNLVARGSRFNGEASAFAPQVLQALEQRGVTVLAGSGEDSGLHGVFLRNGQWEWAADPRREGTVGHPIP